MSGPRPNWTMAAVIVALVVQGAASLFWAGRIDASVTRLTAVTERLESQSRTYVTRNEFGAAEARIDHLYRSTREITP